jgi:hypothetical protein
VKTKLATGYDSPLAVSTTAPSDAVIRRAGRLLAMVHELHKAGYQRLRISPGYSLDGTEWRCYLLAADNMHPDGWTPRSIDKAHLYTSAQGKRYFGWSDAGTDDARSLATKFLERFPETARVGAGQDWAYAGWFTSALGCAENSRLPVLYGGRNYELRISTMPYPPPLVESDSEYVSDTGLPIISNNELTQEDLPPPHADYELLWMFCLSYDGYGTALLFGVDCGAIADQTFRGGLENATMEELRMTAFIRQRAIKWGGKWPPDERLLGNIRDVVEEIRRRLTYTPDGPQA